jgi:Dyp-type peroxidase family
MTTIERHDVQGLVVSGYGEMHEARYLLLRVVDPGAARRWVAGVADRVTASDRPQERRCTNLAFTAEGLAALGLTAAELRTFSVPFQEGMTAPHRRRILGDLGPSDPAEWDWGGTQAAAGTGTAEPVHALLLLYARDAATMAAVEAEELEGLADGDGFAIVRHLTPEPLPGKLSVGKFGVEHFGFADGMSQPVVEGSGQEEGLSEAERQRSLIAAGEAVLGYPNGYGELTPWPRLLAGGGDEAFGRNGTYLVMRQLSQDVARFWTFLDDRTKDAAGGSSRERMDRLGAALVGRWPSGAPLVLSPHRDDPDLGTANAFGFAEVDPFGERCPLGAHVRRANPRDALVSDAALSLELANLHRIIRRGRVYGPGLDDVFTDDGRDRGLFFLCVNANIERQFEFVHHTWLNNPKFGGVNAERDPIVGNEGRPEPECSFTIQDVPFRRRVRGIPSFVTVRGGAYLFLPGIAALRTLGGRHG